MPITQLAHSDIEPWDRQMSEGPEAFQAFLLYRDMTPKRSTGKVALACGKHVRLITRWSARWQWVNRCREYDRYLDRLARAAREKEILEFRKRAAQQSRGKAQTLMLADMALSAKLQASPTALAELQNLSVAELVSLSMRGAPSLPLLHRSEALALGDVENRIVEPADDDVLTRAIQDNDELLSLAATLIQRASTLGAGSGAAAAGGSGESGEQGAVAKPAASDVPQLEAGGGPAPAD